MAAARNRFPNNLPPQVQAEIIKCIRAILIGTAIFLFIKFRFHTTEKSKVIEKSTTIELQGGFEK